MGLSIVLLAGPGKRYYNIFKFVLLYCAIGFKNGGYLSVSHRTNKAALS